MTLINGRARCMHQVDRFLPAKPDAFILIRGRIHCNKCLMGRDWIYLGTWLPGQEIEPLWYDRSFKIGWSCDCPVRFPPQKIIPKDNANWQYADEIPTL